MPRLDSSTDARLQAVQLPPEINRLGTLLDHAERMVDICLIEDHGLLPRKMTSRWVERLHKLKVAYWRALYLLPDLPPVRPGHSYGPALARAEAHLALLRAVGSEFRLERELLDADYMCRALDDAHSIELYGKRPPVNLKWR
jgi:hypothetical protein